jgi:hypothetical protein
MMTIARRFPVLFLLLLATGLLALAKVKFAGPWQQRLWKSLPAEHTNVKVSARVPAERPLVCFLSITDSRHLTVATPHTELAEAGGRASGGRR